MVPQLPVHSASAEPDNGPGVLVATIAPGTNAMSFGPGTAMLIKAGSVLTFQMHYMAMGMAMKDQQ